MPLLLTVLFAAKFMKVIFLLPQFLEQKIDPNRKVLDLSITTSHSSILLIYYIMVLC